VEIKKLLIGTGFIGGKSVGMLLARNILRRDPTFDWNAELEIHDSFYIGSDIFYSYMVQNGWWKLLMAQKTDEGYFEVARELKQKMLHGIFPDEVKEQFQLMLEYYGQAPIIVRSSSLLEDLRQRLRRKYESYFCVNQGTPRSATAPLKTGAQNLRLHDDEDALTYRLQRGMASRTNRWRSWSAGVRIAPRIYFFRPGGRRLSYNTFVCRTAWTRRPACAGSSSAWARARGTGSKTTIRGSSPSTLPW
jgi:hypothetical protein